MLPYLAAIFLSVIILNVAHRFNFKTIAMYFCYFLAAIPLLIITSFKNITVGTDTVTYVYFFNKVTTLNQAINFAIETKEFGFWILNALGHYIADNYYTLFFLVSIVVTSCYLYSIKTFKLGTLSFITLLLIGPYFFQLNGTRQAITIAIFSVSLIFIIKKQPLRYFLSIIIGFFFHKSMIVCLPIYFIFIGEIKPRKITAILLVFILFLIFFQSFIDVASGIDDRYSGYGTRQETTGGVVVSAFNLILLAWFVLCRHIHPHILATKTYDTLLVIYLLGCMVSILSLVLGVNPSGFLRLSWYFVQVNMFLIPMTILSFRDNSTRYIIMFSAISLMVLYFYMTTSAFSNLTPYKFNPVIEVSNES